MSRSADIDEHIETVEAIAARNAPGASEHLVGLLSTEEHEGVVCAVALALARGARTPACL